MASAKIEGVGGWGVGAPSSTVGEVSPGLGLATLGTPGSAPEFQALWGGGGGGGLVQRLTLFQ